MKKEQLAGEFHPSLKSKSRVSMILVTHNKPLNNQKVADFLLKEGCKIVKTITYKGVKIDEQITKTK